MLLSYQSIFYISLGAYILYLYHVAPSYIQIIRNINAFNLNLQKQEVPWKILLPHSIKGGYWMKEQIYVKTQYKDTLFRILFREKQKLLELYNAINNTDYTNPEERSTWRSGTTCCWRLYQKWNTERLLISE